MAAGRCAKKRHPVGFTLIEIVAALVLLGLLGLFTTQLLSTVVRGFVLARSSDAVVQKAQIALQRMTSDFSYLTLVTSSSQNSITYTANFNGSETHTIALNGTTVTYTVDSTAYVLTDAVAATSGLQFTYFSNYAATASNTFASGTTTIIGISLTMHGADWDSNQTKTFTTRVTTSKLGQ
jgi:prepilin-type N-terminal cleavage/methylation domain-containing protein